MGSQVVRSRATRVAVTADASAITVVTSSERLHFILPDRLYRLFLASVERSSGQGPLFLFTVFQEVLRRYLGQNTVAVSFAEGESDARTIVLDGDLALSEIMKQHQGGAADLHGREGHHQPLDVPLDGQFFFYRAQDIAPALRRRADGCGLCCCIQSSGKRLSVWLDFERKIWEVATIKSFASSLENALADALCHPETPIGRLELLSPADKMTLDGWNATAEYYPRSRVDELFELRAKESPDAIAVSFLDERLSYRSLSQATRRLAIRLESLGVKPGVLVGVCMDRCSDMVVALLSTFKAGAGYLPLDPAFPEDRIAFMEEDAHPLVVITQTHLREKFKFTAKHVICVDESSSVVEPIDFAENLGARGSSLDNIAYVLYTSGSTGKPKGVQISHRALTNMLTAVTNDLSLDHSDTVLATTTISFDISTFELFAPLVAGAHLVIAPREVTTDGERLAQSIRESEATVLQATPAGWQVLLEAGWEGKAGLKMLTAGEPLTWILAQRLLARGGTLWNLYGPTEVTVYATGQQIFKEDARINVGPPLANYTAYVLDQHRQRLPIGAVGELFLGGIGVGLGYLNRPQLTSERFVQDPFSSNPEARLYRTGDLARMLPNGDVDLLGRADNQIKLRGYRIELEEIEASLDSHPGISKAMGRVVQVGDGDQSLVAYVVLRENASVDEADWRNHVARTLPSYMVPTAFMVMNSFALTPNGKVDRKALPAFQTFESEQPEATTAIAEDSPEQAILHCWRKVLGRPALSLDQDFFAAGGHSLLVMRMLTEVNKKFGHKLPPSLLVEGPTARKFAERMMQFKSAPTKYLVLMQPEGSLPPVYLVHHLLGDILIYRNLANYFAPHRPVYGVQAPADLVERSQPSSLKSLASEYVAEILERHIGGPVHLAGFSSGSVLAFEMARQLESRGLQVGLVGLIDGGLPSQGPPMPTTVRYTKIAIRKLCKIAFKMRDELADGPKQFVMKRVRHFWLQLRIRILESSGTQAASTLEQALLLAERGYEGKPYGGNALLIRFRDEAWKFGPDPLMGWSGLVQGGIDVVDFEGGHITGMGPVSAPIMGSLLNRHMQTYEAIHAAKPAAQDGLYAKQDWKEKIIGDATPSGIAMTTMA